MKQVLSALLVWLTVVLGQPGSQREESSVFFNHSSWGCLSPLPTVLCLTTSGPSRTNTPLPLLVLSLSLEI